VLLNVLRIYLDNCFSPVSVLLGKRQKENEGRGRKEERKCKEGINRKTLSTEQVE